jgi:hypothetical protein
MKVVTTIPLLIAFFISLTLSVMAYAKDPESSKILDSYGLNTVCDYTDLLEMKLDEMIELINNVEVDRMSQKQSDGLIALLKELMMIVEHVENEGIKGITVTDKQMEECDNFDLIKVMHSRIVPYVEYIERRDEPKAVIIDRQLDY